MKSFIVVFACIAAFNAQAEQIKPESFVRFPNSGIACLSREALFKAWGHMMKGETTKANAMFLSADRPRGQCIMLDQKKRFKVLSAEYSDPEAPDVGVLELVGPGDKSSEGAWAMTLGSEVAK